MGTPHVLKILREEEGYYPQLLIAGERTGEKGDEIWGEVCVQNRGVMRFDLIAHAERGHSGVSRSQSDLTERLLSARAAVTGILRQHLTLNSEDGWQSQVRFPFIQVGTPGVYNVTADRGLVGVEVRPIPQDDLRGLVGELEVFCESQDLELAISVMENGIACDQENPYLKILLQSIQDCSGAPTRIGKKLPGTSARFAPQGQGVVWGQSGIGPHAKGERHFIPSILPYYQALERLSELLRTQSKISGI